jgi:hypothetical protein
MLSLIVIQVLIKEFYMFFQKVLLVSTLILQSTSNFASADLTCNFDASLSESAKAALSIIVNDPKACESSLLWAAQELRKIDGDLAVRAFITLLKIENISASNLLTIAKSLEEMGETKKAIETYVRIVATNSSDSYKDISSQALQRLLSK